MRRLILLISVGWLPPYLLPSGACLSLGSSVLYKPPNAAEGYTKPGLRLFRCTLEPSRVKRFSMIRTIKSDFVLGDDWYLLGNGPQKSCQLTGNSHSDHIGMFPSCHQSLVTFT
jgi:hypothetical protein